jgi:hypothetical protein
VRVSDFKPGERVRHMNGATGVVLGIEQHDDCGPCVAAEFDPVPIPRYPQRKWRGLYPQSWLDQHPHGLQKSA